MRPFSQPVDQDVATASATPVRGGGATTPPVRIQLLHVPDCPNLGELRRRVHQSVAQLGVSAVIEEVEGPYPSPTLLVNGDDVTGRPLGSDPACRLDTPTTEQIIAAITRIGAQTEPSRRAATAPSSL